MGNSFERTSCTRPANVVVGEMFRLLCQSPCRQSLTSDVGCWVTYAIALCGPFVQEDTFETNGQREQYDKQPVGRRTPVLSALLWVSVGL